MSYNTGLSALGPTIARKRLDRRDRNLNLLGHRDALMAPVVSGILALARRKGSISESLAAYMTRKQRAVRADYYRVRYGRDYHTGRNRHPFRFRVLRADRFRGDDI